MQGDCHSVACESPETGESGVRGPLGLQGRQTETRGVLTQQGRVLVQQSLARMGQFSSGIPIGVGAVQGPG
jgi:hypothetical protein